MYSFIYTKYKNWPPIKTGDTQEDDISINLAESGYNKNQKKSEKIMIWKWEKGNLGMLECWRYYFWTVSCEIMSSLQ